MTTLRRRGGTSGCGRSGRRIALDERRERRADPVLDKHLGTFCEYFEFIKRAWTPKTESNPREAAARERMNKLFGD